MPIYQQIIKAYFGFEKKYFPKRNMRVQKLLRNDLMQHGSTEKIMCYNSMNTRIVY